MITLPTPIPIYIHPFFILMSLYIGYVAMGSINGMIIAAFLVFLSILIHELGHALTAVLFKQKTTITFQLLGGVTERQGPALKKWQEFLIILNVPLAGILCFVVSAFLYNTTGSPYFKFASIINFWWTILNLIPIIPLDGGQLLRVVLEGFFGVNGLRAAALISLALGLLMTGFAFINDQVFLGAIFAIFTFESWRLYKQMEYVNDTDSEPLTKRLMGQAEKLNEAGEPEKARPLYEMVREKAVKGSLFSQATFRLAEMEGALGNFKRAYDLIKPVKKQLDEEGLKLYHRLAFENQDWKEVLSTGAYFPDLNIYAMNAVAAAELGDKEAAQGWLNSYLKNHGDQALFHNSKFQILRTIHTE